MNDLKYTCVDACRTIKVMRPTLRALELSHHRQTEKQRDEQADKQKYSGTPQ